LLQGFDMLDKAAGSSETSVSIYQTVWRHVQDGRKPSIHCYANHENGRSTFLRNVGTYNWDYTAPYFRILYSEFSILLQMKMIRIARHTCGPAKHHRLGRCIAYTKYMCNERCYTANGIHYVIHFPQYALADSRETRTKKWIVHIQRKTFSRADGCIFILPHF
jgi:hypothetical protein